MVEYLYDAVKATAGEVIAVSTRITDDEGNVNSSGCVIEVYKDDTQISTTPGELSGEEYSFNIPAIIETGRYFYLIKDLEGNSFEFKQPLYLV